MKLVRLRDHTMRRGECVDRRTARELLVEIGTDSVWIDCADIIIMNSVFADTLFDQIARFYLDYPSMFIGLLGVDTNIMLDMLRSIRDMKTSYVLENFGFVYESPSHVNMPGVIGSVQSSVRSAVEVAIEQKGITSSQWMELDGGKHELSTYSTYLIKAWKSHLLARKNGPQTYTYYLPDLEAP